MCDMRPRDKVARYCSGIFWLSGVRDPDQIRMGPMFNSSAVEWSLLIFSGRILCIASNQHYPLHHFVKITVCKFSCVSICGLLCGFQGLQVKARNFVVFAWTSLKSAFRYGVIITEIWTGLQARQNHTTHTLFSFFNHRLSYSTLANDAVYMALEDKKRTVITVCQESKSRWRRVLKTLNLLEFLIKNGSERIIDETRREQFKAQRHFGSPHFSWYLPLLDITIPQNNTTAFKRCFLYPSSESPKTMIDHFLISDGFKFQGENGGNDWGVKVVDPKCPPGATSDGFHLFGGWYLAGWIFVWKISVETMLMYHTGMNQICFVFLLPEVKIRVLQSGIRCGWEQRKEGHM